MTSFIYCQADTSQKGICAFFRTAPTCEMSLRMQNFFLFFFFGGGLAIIAKTFLKLRVYLKVKLQETFDSHVVKSTSQ